MNRRFNLTSLSLLSFALFAASDAAPAVEELEQRTTSGEMKVNRLTKENQPI
jgi:cytochrome c-type biogenesis protein CcmH/NrfG